MLASSSEFLALRDTCIHVRHWGKPNLATVFFLHGWMDVSASWQFVVDALGGNYHVIAPDWRGFGPSARKNRYYQFTSHLGDLEALLDHYSPTESVHLVGHSMGGILGGLYAGIRPERVKSLVSIEGFGILPLPPETVAERFRQWLDEQKNPPRMQVYADREAFARRLMQADRFLTLERARFFAQHLGKFGNGKNRESSRRYGIVWNADPWHKATIPSLFPIEECKAIWREATCPVLSLLARDSWLVHLFDNSPEEMAERLACFSRGETFWLENSDHMLHHDQPEEVAAAMTTWWKKIAAVP